MYIDMYKDTIDSTPLSTDTTEIPLQPNQQPNQQPNEPPSWQWKNVWWLLVTFGIGTLVLAGGATWLLEATEAPLPVSARIATVFSVIYLLLIGCVYWFAIRWGGGSWQELGVRKFSPIWLILLPLLFMLQLTLILLINSALIVVVNGPLDNPQLDALEQGLVGATAQAPAMEIPLSTPAAPQTASTPAVAVDEPVNNELTAQYERFTRNVELTSNDLWLLILTIGIIAPFSEELFFRGMLYPLMRRRRWVWLAIVSNAFIFSLVHFIPILMPALLAIGIMLAWVREKSGSIWPSFVLHVMQNSLAVYTIYLLANRGIVG